MSGGFSVAPAEPPLSAAFFARPARTVAVELLGRTLLHSGVGGTIIETEAYEQDDPACHAFVGRTERNRALFGEPGLAYVYLCYGIHRMFNVVTDTDGVAGAVLVRALEPTAGIERMRERRGRDLGERELCSGPGKLCEALGIELTQTFDSVVDGPIEILAGRERAGGDVTSGPRIGITKGAELPWRYCLAASHRYLSRPA